MKLLLCFFLIYSLIITSDINNEIIWKEGNKLTYNDFKCELDKSSNRGAISNLGIHFEDEIISHSLKFKVYAYFNPKLSWIKFKNKNLLNHEQVHFDIIEIYSRKLVKELLKIKKVNHTHSDLKNLQKEIVHEKDLFSQEYDNQTNFSINIVMQNKWTNNINKILDSLKEYKTNKEYILKEVEIY